MCIIWTLALILEISSHRENEQNDYEVDNVATNQFEIRFEIKSTVFGECG